MNDYVLLEDVADERGESPAIVGRFLFRSKCDLYLHLDESKELRTCEVKYEPLGELWTETNIVTPGHYRLLPESATEAIKRIGSDNLSIEGLIFVTKFEDGKTFNLRFGKDDSSVSIVAKKSDIDSLTPPSKYQTAPVSMYPASPENKIFENFEGKNSSKRKGEIEDHTLIIWEAMQSLDNDLKKEAKPTMIWNYLRKNINKYNTNGVIINISHDEMKYFKSNATEGNLTKESFRNAIKRLRKNPPK